MRTLKALKKLAAKFATGTVTGGTVDEVLDYAEAHFKIAESDEVKLKINGKNISDIFESNGTTAKLATTAESANGLVLTSPDESVWDISIANDGTISGTKRT